MRRLGNRQYENHWNRRFQKANDLNYVVTLSRRLLFASYSKAFSTAVTNLSVTLFRDDDIELANLGTVTYLMDQFN